MALEVAVRVPPCAPLPTLVELVKHMEDLGIDRVSFPDSQLLWRDVWSTATAAALSTSRIGISVSVTNPVTRHPTVTASAARSVAEIAPGRLVVAVGAGDSALTHIGVPHARTRDIGDAVSAIRGLLRGETVEHPVHPWRLHDPVQVPVLIAASGPRNLALAGQVADGIVAPGMAWERDVDIVRTAAVAAGRDPDDLIYMTSRSCVITDDPERDAAIFKPMCLRLAQMSGTSQFEAAGFPIEVPPHDLRFGDLGHPEDWDEAVRVCSQWITDEAALWFARSRSLFGTPAEVASQLANLESSGINRILVAHPGAFTLPRELINSLATGVLPVLRRLTSVSSPQ
ncbi:5,10-methylenetetrahydromethanopterin reductase [Frankia canadensis]|uniref:5,10-methylenetetrahydromethanopterin reductase n=1 Tax=Frankia canadensis TaxID=1836972 RepID=A0A2I2KI40_9ACTN|nr:LLM class flavin-dependent oxidoreductase [Frankia canadensis]SNQ45299.1 5,10-methylenetetrahydromethanopterin reductase [Frankia canadensis]SOU52589.1 5,10-methylenetetrahydromethanopterin reductase [Frankia canadensis]